MQSIFDQINSESYLKKTGGKTLLEKQIVFLIRSNVCRILLIGKKNKPLNKIIQKKWISENAQIDFVENFEEALKKSFMDGFFIQGAADFGGEFVSIEAQKRGLSFFDRRLLYIPFEVLGKIQSPEILSALSEGWSQMILEGYEDKDKEKGTLAGGFLAFFSQLQNHRREKRLIRFQYRKVKACLFDFDGTLVDDMDDFADLAAKTIERHYGVPFKLARKKYVEFTGLPFILQLHSIFPGALKNDEVSNDFETAKESIFFSKHIESNVRETLNWLKQKGIKISVTSGGFKDSIDEFCRKEGVEFDLVMGYEKGFEKGPTHFAHLLKTFGLEKEEVLFMGDSLKDAEKGLAYGFRFIAKCGLFSKAAFLEKFKGIETVDSISELKKRLK